MKHRWRWEFSAAALIWAGCMGGTVSGATPPVAAAGSIKAPHLEVSLLARAVYFGYSEGEREFLLGLRFQPEAGWHIYWRNPGDSGAPPVVRWHFPLGWTAGEMQWPVPERLGGPPIVDYGYSGDVILLTPLRTKGRSDSAGRTGQVAAEVDWTVCSEVCIEGKALLSASIPPPGSELDAATQEKLFAAARARLPKPMPAACRVDVEDAGSEFILTLASGKRESKAAFFPETPERVENAAPQELQLLPDGMRLRLQKSSGLLRPIATLTGVLEIGGKGYEIHAPVRKQTGGRRLR